MPVSGAEPTIVLNVLYNEPSDPDAFERYYAETHLPLVDKIAGISRAVLTKGLPGPDGSKPPFYRTAQIFFADAAQMAASMGSPEGAAAAADIANFADGGVTVFPAALV